MNVSVGHTLPHQNILDYYTPQTVYIDTAAYGLNLLVGFPLNVYVLWLIATGAGGSVANDFFTLNLTLTDAIYCLSAVLVFLDFYVFHGSIYVARAFFTAFICLTRPLFQCCICVERYLAVVHPVLFLKYKLLRYKMAVSCLVWLMVVGCCVVGLLMSFPTIMFLFYMAQYMFVFSVKAFCCVSVLRVLKRPGPGDRDREREGTNSMKQRAFSIILVIIVSHVLTLLPISIVMPLQTKLPLTDYFFALSFCLLIVVVVGLIQPVLYIQRSGRPPCARRP